MRAFQALLCCALLAGCMRNVSSLPSTVPNSTSWQAKYSDLPRATEPQFTNLYNFTGLTDGGSPESVLATINGEIYGTTTWGGAYGYGGIFEMSPPGTERLIHSFETGASVAFGLVALDGKLYGLAHVPYHNKGTFVEVTTSGKERELYRFDHAHDAGGFDDMWSGLIAMNHKLYGMSYAGGSISKYCRGLDSGCGAVVELSKSGAERVLYRFSGRADGFGPLGTLVAFDGKLYGTTTLGGSPSGWNGYGVVFELSMSGKERTLYTFKPAPDANEPIGNLVVINGKLYGASLSGGKYGSGAIFEVSTSGKERLLISFRKHGGVGSFVTGLTVMGGKILGIMGATGRGRYGTISEITTLGEARILHSFDTFHEPTGGLVLLGGKLYGATESGGLRGCSSWPTGTCGTLFELSL